MFNFQQTFVTTFESYFWNICTKKVKWISLQKSHAKIKGNKALFLGFFV